MGNINNFQRKERHLSMKEGCLFCNMNPPNWDASHCVFLVSLESSQQEGVQGLGFMMFGLVMFLAS
jgi:hypothetical protein